MNPNVNSSHGAEADPPQQPTTQIPGNPPARTANNAISATILNLQVDFVQLMSFQARCRDFEQQMADNDDQLARIHAQFNQPTPQPPENIRLLLAMASLYLAENRQYVEQLQTMQTETAAILRIMELLSDDGEEVNTLRRVQEGLRQFVATAEDVLGVNRSNTERVRRKVEADPMLELDREVASTNSYTFRPKARWLRGSRRPRLSEHALKTRRLGYFCSVTATWSARAPQWTELRVRGPEKSA